MKKEIRRFLALALAAVMALGLCACGDGEQKPNEQAEPVATAAPEFVYNASYTTVDNSSFGGWLNANLYTDEGFYCTTQEIVGDETPEGVTPEWENQYAVWAEVMYFVDYETGKMKKLDQYSAFEKETAEDRDHGSYIYSMSTTPAGELMLFINYSEYWSDAPEGTEQYSDLWYQYYRSSNEYYIRTIDGSGAEKSCIPLQIPEEIASPTDGSWFYPYGVEMDKNGKIVLVSEKKVLIFDSEGVMTDVIDLKDNMWAESIIRMGDGSLCVRVWGDTGAELYPIDTEAKKLGDELNFPNDAYQTVYGGGDYDFYYTSGINFFGFDSEANKSELLFNWINCDVDSDNLSGTYVLNDGTVVGLLNTWDKNYENCTSEIVKLKKVPYDSVPHKENIVLATEYLNWETKGSIIDFNRNNDKYRIEVRDYSEFNTEEDYSAGLTKLKTEIMAGNVPDIIDMNGLPLDQFAAKGLLEDLYPYLDADSELSRDDFFENILHLSEKDGKLLTTCSNFSISTVMGAASVVGDKPGWNYDQLFAALENMPEDCRIFDYYITRNDILSRGLNVDMDSFCDWGTGKVNFDSDSFKNLLRFAAKFPAEFDWEHYDYSEEEDSWTLISQGRQMLLMTDIYELRDAGMYDCMFGEQGATYVGFPTESGSGNSVRLMSGYAMSAGCKNKEAAWDFLRTFFTEEYQDGQWELPTNVNSFNKKLKDAMTPNYRLTSDGDAMLDEDGNKIKEPIGSYYLSNGEMLEYYELSQEQADKVLDLINSTTKLANDDYSIVDIVTTEAEPFFLGQKSVDDVARLIQSKVSIYVNEQR